MAHWLSSDFDQMQERRLHPENFLPPYEDEDECDEVDESYPYEPLAEL